MDPFESMTPRETTLAIETVMLTGIVGRLIEALHAVSGTEGYEDLTVEERIYVGESALAAVPEGLGYRVIESLDMTKQIFNPELMVEVKTLCLMTKGS